MQAASVLLLDPRGRRFLVPLDAPMVRVPRLGTFEAAKLRGSVGRSVDVGGKRFLVLEPSWQDFRAAMDRGPQLIAPKDIAAILYETNIGSGVRVVESGCGSGALTVALARAVRPEGRVISYDMRPESLRLARANAEAAGLGHLIEFREGDVRRPIPDRDIDAFLLDIPDPWSAVTVAWEALRPCGHFASFSPNMEQVKETVAAIRRHPFVDIRTIELIERELEVRDVGVRPSHAPLGHTGYLTFARKVLEPFP